MKLNTKRTLIVGLAFMSISAFWQIYDSIVPLILKDVFDLRDDIAGIIMALDNVLALFMLPIFGALSDKTNTRFGKRMPYIVLGTLAACRVDQGFYRRNAICQRSLSHQKQCTADTPKLQRV